MPGPDLGTDSDIMTWMYDTYATVHGEKDINAEASTTGKHISEGGIEGRVESAGRGVYYGLRVLLEDKSFCEKAGFNTGIDGKSFIIQGFGNVGYYAAKYFNEDGAILKGIVEKDCALWKESGFDHDEIQEWAEEHGTLKKFPHADQIEIDNPPSYLER